MQRTHRVVILAVISTAACGSDSSTLAPAERPLVERSVDPALTASDITGGIGIHVVVAPSSMAEKNVLLLFLPGTGGRPDHYGSVLRHAGQTGYHAIGLSYRNAEAVNDLCPSVVTPGCHEDVRIEVITGESRSPLVSVDRANSIDNRMRALLDYLHRTYPNEGWNGYLSNGAPRWDRITVAGHSQGGGHAAMIAQLRVVNRAILFSATEPAQWTAAPFMTPRERIYGFVHRLEPSFTGMTLSWRQMGIPGQLTSVDAGASPFGGAHQLETSVLACRGEPISSALHGCVVVEARTPLTTDGKPSFAPVWTYLLGG